jgi:hypothetical protein
MTDKTPTQTLAAMRDRLSPEEHDFVVELIVGNAYLRVRQKLVARQIRSAIVKAQRARETGRVDGLKAALLLVERDLARPASTFEAPEPLDRRLILESGR